ncbi:Oligopeptide transporter [Penicillium canariense]|uniref:Oligopeptide transporter n=1 Tax=Penicillium canariense TaxID=189055 RepID=A0A9W9I858_9EURO|nr:Oligopeptide transporter [Penicillium canariense]KAJ5168601.1 Oligopeptide transporter [Penicillium canariense]
MEKSHSLPTDPTEPTEPASEIPDVDKLPRVADSIPLSVWLVALLALAERFTFYGLSAPFQNYMQNGRDDPLRPGALGWGQRTASLTSNLFYILTCITPIFGAIAADKWLGRYRLLVVSFAIYLVGTVLLLVSSLPEVLGRKSGGGVFITSIILIGVGMSGANANLAAFIGDQYTKEGGTVEVRNGNRVVIDRDRTIESIYNLFYWCLNVGSLSGIATTLLERNVGFWAAFLLPLCALSISAALLVFGRRHYTMCAPEKSALPDAVRASLYASRSGFRMDHAKPQYQLEHHARQVPWSESFVDELKQGLKACRMLLAWPILWLCRVQLSTNLISQAAQMDTASVPNDMIYNANPVVIIIFLPLFDSFLYPWLRRRGITLNAVTRISLGFVLEAFAIAYAAIVQKLIYSYGPCYEFPLQCAASQGGAIPNHISVAVQIPVYVLEAFEIFATPAGYEMAFLLSPKSMKSILQAMFSLTNAVGASLSIAISPIYKNPALLWMYVSLAVAMAIDSSVFYLVFGIFDSGEEGQKKNEKKIAPIMQDPELDVETQ